MRCSSYCSASSYDMQALVENLINKGSEPKYFDDVIHIKKDNRKKNSSESIDTFYFPFGCIIVWGAEEDQEKTILNEVKKFEHESVEDISNDLIYYKYDLKQKKTYIDEEKNEMILGSKLDFVKLSISHALAQSAKLAILEGSVMKLIDKTNPIQKEMASKGSVSLSKKEISKQIGRLFSERYMINQHSDILDVPEFFWRRPSYEPLYQMTVEFQDIQLRQNIMYNRLDMINDLYSILSEELNHRHSSRLEIIIIALIAIEVGLALFEKNIWSKLVSLFTG